MEQKDLESRAGGSMHACKSNQTSSYSVRTGRCRLQLGCLVTIEAD